MFNKLWVLVKIFFDSHLSKGFVAAVIFILPCLLIFKYVNSSFWVWLFFTFWALCLTVSKLSADCNYNSLLFNKSNIALAKSFYNNMFKR